MTDRRFTDLAALLCLVMVLFAVLAAGSGLGPPKAAPAEPDYPNRPGMPGYESPVRLSDLYPLEAEPEK
jgi:hypothetical protein